MMKQRLGLAATAALAASACVPMEQASLIYSASHSIGVNVEAGTPQNPGLLTTIGYRSLNAAYVPVLAAKNCPERDNDCHDVTYRPVPISGSNVEGTQSSTTDQSEIGRLATEMKRLSSEIGTLASQTDQLVTTQNELIRLNGRLLQLPQSDVPEESAERSEIERQIAALTKSRSAEALTIQIRENQNQLRRLNEDRDNAERRLASASQRAQSDTKTDAYSVFGSFDGTAGGRSEGASLQVGQVFSTGIAAQNLTQGFRRAAVLEGRAQCIDALRERTSGYPPEKYAELVVQLCGARADEDSD